MPRPSPDLAILAPWLDDRLDARSARACAAIIAGTFPRHTVGAVIDALMAYSLRTDRPGLDTMDAWLLAFYLREHDVDQARRIDALAQSHGPVGVDTADPRDVRPGGEAYRVGPVDASERSVREVRGEP